MQKTFLESILGWPFGDFSDSLFKTKEMKRIETAVDENGTKTTDDKYIFSFKLGDIDFSCLKVSLKDNRLKVSYEKEDENNSIKYHFSRTLPEDADAGTIYAETDEDGKILTISMKKKKALPAEKKTKEIPISIED